MRVLSLDVSTTCIGYAFFQNNKLEQSGAFVLNKKLSLNEKGDSFLSLLQSLNLEVDRIVIEAPLLACARSMAKTLSVLQRFNGIISYITCKLYNIEPEYVSAATARKGVCSRKDKTPVKQQVLDYLIEEGVFPTTHLKYTKSGKINPFVFDESDAILIGYHYITKHPF